VREKQRESEHRYQPLTMTVVWDGRPLNQSTPWNTPSSHIIHLFHICMQLTLSNTSKTSC